MLYDLTWKEFKKFECFRLLLIRRQQNRYFANAVKDADKCCSPNEYRVVSSGTSKDSVQALFARIVSIEWYRMVFGYSGALFEFTE